MTIAVINTIFFKSGPRQMYTEAFVHSILESGAVRRGDPQWSVAWPSPRADTVRRPSRKGCRLVAAALLSPVTRTHGVEICLSGSRIFAWSSLENPVERDEEIL